MNKIKNYMPTDVIKLLNNNSNNDSNILKVNFIVYKKLIYCEFRFQIKYRLKIYFDFFGINCLALQILLVIF